MLFHRFDGTILDRGEYWVVKTPSNPGYFLGNFLLFFRAPERGSLARWRELFGREFASGAGAGHLAFFWDSPSEGLGDVTELLLADFTVDRAVVLTARSVRAPGKINHAVEVRPIRTDAEWLEATEGQIVCRNADYPGDAYRIFKERQMQSYRAMADKGMGQWFGAFLDGRMVGDLGLYRDETVGRFQSVETHPDVRRRGVCGRLVYEASRHAFEYMGVTDLVMVADENYHAAKIYESAGFARSSWEYSAFWWKREKE
jgi:ribosomal protein S18 acetylase RimI-like enzyme